MSKKELENTDEGRQLIAIEELSQQLVIIIFNIGKLI